MIAALEHLAYLLATGGWIGFWGWVASSGRWRAALDESRERIPGDW